MTDDTLTPYGRLIEDIIHKGLVSAVLSVAHELGLLEALTRGPVTSQQLADMCSLKERYVREALHCLACAGVVHVTRDIEHVTRDTEHVTRDTEHVTRDTEHVTRNTEHVTYHVTGEEAAALRGPAGMMLGVLRSQATRYAGVLECFRRDGPWGFSSSDDFAAQASSGRQASGGRVEADMALCLREAPGLRAGLESGIKAIEFGSGGGELLQTFAQHFPKSSFVGSEVSAAAMAYLQRQCNTSDNVTLRRLDLLHMPGELHGEFDFAFVKNVIHDLPDPLRGLQSCHNVLKPGSTFACWDIDSASDVMQNLDTPHCAALYASSTFHCVPQAYQDADSTVLGACWGRGQAEALLRGAGFTVTGVHAHGRNFVLYLCRA